jgi:hypothetical protein
VFLRTETGSAAVLLGMAVAALAWVKISASSYETVWGARLSVRLAGAGVSLDLREWVNSGLMTFFFFVFGLEAAASSIWANCASGPGWRCPSRPTWAGWSSPSSSTWRSTPAGPRTWPRAARAARTSADCSRGHRRP